MKINRTALMEGVKEILRLAFFAAVAAIITYLTNVLTSLDPTSVEAIALTVFLRFVDKYVHKNDDIKANGIAPL